MKIALVDKQTELQSDCHQQCSAIHPCLLHSFMPDTNKSFFEVNEIVVSSRFTQILIRGLCMSLGCCVDALYSTRRRH